MATSEPIPQGVAAILDAVHESGTSKVKVAVCDVEKDGLHYLEWGKNQIRDEIRRLLDEPGWREGDDHVPGGRDVGKEIVETYYAKRRGRGASPGCATYADFRELLDREKDVTAVKVMTPDHTHATIALAALKKGMNVIVHKPLANRVLEGFEGHLDLTKYPDEYEAALRKMIEDKAEGRKIVAPGAPKPAKVVNLMDALRKSLEQVQGQGGQRARRGERPSRSTPAARGSHRRGRVIAHPASPRHTRRARRSRRASA